MDPLSGETLCRLGSIDLTGRGGASKLNLAPASLFDPKLKGLTWTADPIAGSRVVQIRVYSPPSPIIL